MSESYKKIAKAIKAKGLQKLKFWCELCHKQCRDDNGYRSHCSSDAHLRQVKLFAQNSRSIIDSNSRIFERDFVELIRRRYRFKTVLINRVYNEFIQDKEHLHMNATRWTSLTGLCLHLGEKGICDINQTDRGWEIRYIDRDRTREAQQEEIRRKEKMELDAESRLQKKLSDQYKAYQKIYGDTSDQTETRTDNNEHIPQQTPPSSVSFKINSKKLDILPKKMFKEIEEETICEETEKTSIPNPIQVKRPEFEDRWICPNIVVKIINKDVGDGTFYQKKGYIVKLEDDYVALVKLFDERYRLKIDQADLETVLPRIGSTLLIVGGAYKGEKAKLIELDVKNYRVLVSLKKAGSQGIVSVYKPYEEVCKIHESA